MTTRRILRASEGKVLTNGEIYGKIIYLADDVNVEDYREITEEEYAEILRIEEENSRPVGI